MKHVSKTDDSVVWSHEESYKGLGIVAMTHRNRLRHIIHLLHGIENQEGGSLADYGCSDGYIISILQKGIFLNRDWKFYGFDHVEELLSKANGRNLPHTEFHLFNLNAINRDRSNNFDIVTCFETLEHTGNYKNAFENLYFSCAILGSIVVTIPNERGVPGLLKYFGRKVLRRNAYGDFFNSKSELEYVKALFLNRPIDVFRHPDAEGWGPHLGFDYKQFETFIQDHFVKEQKLKIVHQGSATIYFNRSYVFQKLG